MRELDEESVARMAVELGLARNESTVRSEFNKTLSALSSKTSSIDTSSSPVAIYALFNEIKDKKALDAKLAEEILLLLSRSKSPPSSQRTHQHIGLGHRHVHKLLDTGAFVP